MPRCKQCKEKFFPRFFNQKYCMLEDECIKAFNDIVQGEEQKKRNKRTKEMKEALKTKKDYEKELEPIFNSFIRERDKDEPCISCDAPAGQYTPSAGHYFPAGHNKNLRFDEENVHGQCWNNCNKNKHGNLSEYLPRLIAKIGQAAFDDLKRRKEVERKYTVPELIEMKVIYRDKLRELKAKNK